MSYKVVLESKVKPETADDLMVFLQENLPNVRGFRGCLSVDVLYDEETNAMIFYEEWLSKEDHGNYIGFISENGVMESLVSYLQGPPDVKYFKRLEM